MKEFVIFEDPRGDIVVSGTSGSPDIPLQFLANEIAEKVRGMIGDSSSYYNVEISWPSVDGALILVGACRKIIPSTIKVVVFPP